MVDPLTAIIYGVFVLVIFGAIFWPRKGIIAKFHFHSKSEDKILIEHALKVIYDLESGAEGCSIDKLSGRLSISTKKTSSLISNLKDMGLVDSDSENLFLSPQGRTDALKIIRVHRLWEKYLAEETGIQERDWHSLADKKEHDLSPEEVDQLAARMGNPIIDPHGDPIPNSEGEIIELNGKLLSSMKENETGKIIHLEDEPEIVFAQISVLGLYPGMIIRLIKVEKERIIFEADGEECNLAPQLAANVTVAPAEETKERIESFSTLASLAPESEAEVAAISGAVRGQQRRRLLDFGIVPGTKIKSVMKSPSGDPTAYEIRGTLIAIRKRQANQIYVKN